MNSSSSNKTSPKTSSKSSTIALTSDDKNVLKKLIQIT